MMRDVITGYEIAKLGFSFFIPLLRPNATLTRSLLLLCSLGVLHNPNKLYVSVSISSIQLDASM